MVFYEEGGHYGPHHESYGFYYPHNQNLHLPNEMRAALFRVENKGTAEIGKFAEHLGATVQRLNSCLRHSQHRFRCFSSTWHQLWDGPTGAAHTSGYQMYMATLLVSIVAPKRGGATVFPLLNLSVQLTPGDALMWLNVKADGAMEPKTLHAGCPVLEGKKTAVVTFFHEWQQAEKLFCPIDGNEGYSYRITDLRLGSASRLRDKFSKSGHESAHGTPPQPLQSQNIPQMII